MPRPTGRSLAPWALAVGAAPLVAASFTGHLPVIAGYLPVVAYDLGASFLRMLLAYLLSLGFALSYGYFAAQTRTGERVLIPILDILQSVPILGFFPAAIVLFVSLTPNSWVGPNFASIFLIFTSMSWNMAFGVYESLKSLPGELREASDSFGARGLLRLRQVFVPATVTRLVYNSVLSWTAGWYYLVAAEIISTAALGTSITLPGIGSFLLAAAGALNWDAVVAGLVVLVALVAALDVFAWRPLSRWAERFRYDVVPSAQVDVVGGSRTRAPLRLRRAAGFVARGFVTGVSRVSSPLASLATWTVSGRSGRPRPRARAVLRYVATGAALTLVWLFLIWLVVGVYQDLTRPIDATVRGQIATLPLALASSFGRVVFAYAISLAIALPLAVFLVHRPRAYRVGLPVIETIASVPATAFFPLFVFGLAAFITNGGASILMVITGMIWYLFFNLVSGVRGIPPDLEEAARSFGLTRREYYRRLLLPAIFPAFITGSITAFGGGWNTLVLAEYLQTSQSTFKVLGVGELINLGNGETGGLPLMVSAIFALVLTVITVNELLWKPLYRRAVDKYRYE